MYNMQRRILSQNFLYSRKLVRKLIGRSFIGKNDFVIDIGAGKGILTEILANQAKQVISIEIDPQWCNKLIQKFDHVHNVTIVKGDILHYNFPTYPYKVFSNIPFSIEGKIIHKLINSLNPPEDTYIVIRKDLANRIIELKNSLFSIQNSPWFTFSIVHNFSRFDFEPAARMDTVLMRILKRNHPLLPVIQKNDYQKFVNTGFGNGGLIKRNLQLICSKDKLVKYLSDLSLKHDSRPTDLDIDKWIKLYNLYSKN